MSKSFAINENVVVGMVNGPANVVAATGTILATAPNNHDVQCDDPVADALRGLTDEEVHKLPYKKTYRHGLYVIRVKAYYVMLGEERHRVIEKSVSYNGRGKDRYASFKNSAVAA